MEMIVLEREDLEVGRLLLSKENEVFEVVEDLGRNFLCYQGEKAFQLRSLENLKKIITIFGYINHKNQILVKDFKKIPTLN